MPAAGQYSAVLAGRAGLLHEGVADPGLPLKLVRSACPVTVPKPLFPQPLMSSNTPETRLATMSLFISLEAPVDPATRESDAPVVGVLLKFASHLNSCGSPAVTPSCRCCLRAVERGKLEY